MRIMKPLMDMGVVPNFKSLFENGSCKMKSTVPPLTPPGWASIYSGKNPGKHGLFEFTKRKGYEYEMNTCWDYNAAPPFWKYLADNGKKSVLLNLPMYYPPMRINNCLSVSGFNALDSMDIFHPEFLKAELLGEVSGYRVDTQWHHEFPEDKSELYIQENIMITEARIRALRYLMKKKPWDLFFVVFTGADRMQHFFWQDIINGYPEIIRYYRLLDNAIGLALDDLNKDDFFFIVSDHGFRPIRQNVNLNAVLQQNNLLTLKDSAELPINYVAMRNVVEKLGIVDTLKKMLPARWIDKVHEHAKVEGVFSFKKIDWSRTKAFASSGTYGGISVNLAGRDPSGIVSESEYDAVRDAVINSVLSITADNGDRVVKNTHKREEIYNGVHISEMPDIVLLPEDDYRFDGTLDRDGIFRDPRNCLHGRRMGGEHEVDTVFISHNQGFKLRNQDISVYDIAPSVLNLLGLPIPVSIDGKTLYNSFREADFFDELTGAVFKKQKEKKIDIHAKLKKLKM